MKRNLQHYQEEQHESDTTKNKRVKPIILESTIDEEEQQVIITLDAFFNSSLLKGKFQNQTTMFKMWFSDMEEFYKRDPLLIPIEYCTRPTDRAFVGNSPFFVYQHGSTLAQAIKNEENYPSNLFEKAENKKELEEVDWLYKCARNRNPPPNANISKKSLEMAIKLNPKSLITSFTNEQMLENEHLVVQALEKEGFLFVCLPSILKTRRSLLMVALKTNGSAIRYTSPILKRDKQVALHALDYSITALQYYTPDNDDDLLCVVRKALDKYKVSEFPEGFLKHTHLISNLIEEHPNAFRIGTKEATCNEGLIRKFLMQDINNCVYLDPEHVSFILHDEKLILKMIPVIGFVKMHGKILISTYILKNNMEIVYEILKIVPSLSEKIYPNDPIIISFKSIYQQLKDIDLMKEKSIVETGLIPKSSSVELSTALSQRFALRYPGFKYPNKFFGIENDTENTSFEDKQF